MATLEENKSFLSEGVISVFITLKVPFALVYCELKCLKSNTKICMLEIRPLVKILYDGHMQVNRAAHFIFNILWAENIKNENMQFPTPCSHFSHSTKIHLAWGVQVTLQHPHHPQMTQSDWLLTNKYVSGLFPSKLDSERPFQLPLKNRWETKANPLSFGFIHKIREWKLELRVRPRMHHSLWSTPSRFCTMHSCCSLAWCFST